MPNLYGLVVSDQGQQPMIQARCIDACGKLALNVLEFDGGALVICQEPSCPFPNKETEQPLGLSRMTGDPVFARVMHPEG